MPSLDLVVIVLAVFLLAGSVKGVIGLGMPTISLALLTVVIGLKDAIALTLLPAFLTNVWQGIAGGALAEVLRRMWTLLLPAGIGIWIGVGILAQADPVWLSALLGVLLALYSTYGLLAPRIPAPGRHEPWLNPVVGGVAGVVTGLTGSFIVPGSLYIQAMGWTRDKLIQALGVAFILASATMIGSMAARGLFSADIGLLSLIGVIPAFLGMAAGARLRRRLPEAAFRRVFFAALLLIGVYLTARAFL